MRINKYRVAFVKILSVFSLIFAFSYLNRLFSDVGMLVTPESMEHHQDIIDGYYNTRKTWITSNLGTYLFKYSNIRKPPSYIVRTTPERGYFSVLIWRHWSWLKSRHAFGYGKYQSHDLLFGCSVSNCKFEEDDEFLSTADAVVVHLQRGLLPDTAGRKPTQRWIFWTDESPLHTFTLASSGNMPNLVKLAKMGYNWSMSYRSDSDIPVPYGRTKPLPYPKLNDITQEQLKELVPFWDKKRTDILAAIIMSRCQEFRKRFVHQLRRFMNIDMFGRCAETANHTDRCPGHYRKDCPVISEYLFYLVIENSSCRQYISEKIFHHAYAKGAIPIIMGTPLEDCIKLLPPNSFIHMDNFASIKHLAKEIYDISDDSSRLLSFHTWRNNFEVVEEHGFLETRSLAMCRICEALNYNDISAKVYKLDDILLYLDPKVCCSRNREW